MEYFLEQNQQIIDQKKDHKMDHKMVYWGDKVSYPTFDVVLFILFWGAAYPTFGINLYGYINEVK